MIVGILGLQGCFVPHKQRFSALGVETRRVVYPSDLDGLAGLVLPGGESTTMLTVGNGALWDAVREFATRQPTWGVCAGCILMARQVVHPDQQSLGIIDMTVSRNAYGSQIDSFVTRVDVKLDETTAHEAIFIRAPKILSIGDGVRVLAECRGDMVMVDDGTHLATSFHPELTEDSALHGFFANRCGGK